MALKVATTVDSVYYSHPMIKISSHFFLMNSCMNNFCLKTIWTSRNFLRKINEEKLTSTARNSVKNERLPLYSTFSLYFDVVILCETLKDVFSKILHLINFQWTLKRKFEGKKITCPCTTSIKKGIKERLVMCKWLSEIKKISHVNHRFISTQLCK